MTVTDERLDSPSLSSIQSLQLIPAEDQYVEKLTPMHGIKKPHPIVFISAGLPSGAVSTFPVPNTSCTLTSPKALAQHPRQPSRLGLLFPRPRLPNLYPRHHRRGPQFPKRHLRLPPTSRIHRRKRRSRLHSSRKQPRLLIPPICKSHSLARKWYARRSDIRRFYGFDPTAYYQHHEAGIGHAGCWV